MRHPRPLPPLSPTAQQALSLARTVKAVLFDIDGVMTDGALYFSEQGESLKVFNVMDGQGLTLLQEAGLYILVVTGRSGEPLKKRLSERQITAVRYGVKDKLPAAEALLSELHLDWSELAVMGDDWPDLPLLARAAWACAPCNAHPEVLALVDHVTSHAGGHGAVRECCDLILKATGHYDRQRLALQA